MAKPVTERERARIIAAIKAGDTRNDIAREFGRSQGTITGIAEAAGLAFDRSATKDATAARVADNASRRAALIATFITKAEAALTRLDRPYVVHDFTKDGEFVTGTLEEPPASELRNFMTAAAIAIDKSLALDRHDNAGQGLAAVDAWLRGVTGEAAQTA